MSAKIFISYRREDTSGESGRLKDKLEQIFGPENIFYDVETLEAGLNFEQSISKALEESKVLLAMIGPHWLKIKNAEGIPRIQNEDDWVRKEIDMALQKKLRVIPVLVNGAKMPEASELPAELQELSLNHAQEISSSRWNYDVGELIKVLEKVIPSKKPEPKPIESRQANPRTFAPPQPKTWWQKNYLWLLGSILGFLILIGMCVPEEDYYFPDSEIENSDYSTSLEDNSYQEFDGSTDPPQSIENQNNPPSPIPDFSGKWWLYENGIRSGYLQINQNGSDFSFTYYLFDIPVGSGTGYFQDNYLVSKTFIMPESPGNYGFNYITEDGGKTWLGQTFAGEITTESYLVKN
jgi:hypothetical protein